MQRSGLGETLGATLVWTGSDFTVQSIPTVDHEARLAETGHASERRRPERIPVLIPATALCGDGMEYRCVLQDMSATGAAIGLPKRYRLPLSFKLVTVGRPNGFPVRPRGSGGDFAGLVLDLEVDKAKNS